MTIVTLDTGPLVRFLYDYGRVDGVQLASAARAAALGIVPIGDLVDVDCELIGLPGADKDTE